MIASRTAPPGAPAPPPPRQPLLGQTQYSFSADVSAAVSAAPSAGPNSPNMPRQQTQQKADQSKLQRAFTSLEMSATLNRTKKVIKLSPSGNFVVKSRVPEAVLEGRFSESEEFKTMRYSAVTCDPDNFRENNFNLRVANYGRTTEIFVVVTMYNENAELFNRTMFALAENLRDICSRGKWGWDKDSWKKVVICIVSDGRSKIHPDVLKVLEVMGVYQDGLAQSSVNKKPVEAHLYELTSQVFMDPSLKLWGPADGFPPMQLMFCLKERNMKKINSHRWFFHAFAPLLQPRVCVLIDVGTKPSASSLYHLWEAFFRNEQVAGACGEIRADLGKGAEYWKNLANPLVASQNFEYKISNLLDKSLESVFGYISVLPGAFSAYRYEALQDNGPNTGPLAKYFEGEQRSGDAATKSVFNANLYLAEDRILCFELVAKRHSRWILKYVSKAYAETDVPNTVPEFLSQRRRWLNGSLFAGFYALANLAQVWKSGHRFPRKIAFTIQHGYNVLNQIISWFILGNFSTTFYFLFNDLKGMITDNYAPRQTYGPTLQQKILSGLIEAGLFVYPVLLSLLFIIAFGNRPQAFRWTYTTTMFVLGLVGTGMVVLLVYRIISLLSTDTNALSASYDTLLSDVATAAQQPTGDALQYIINSVLWQTTSVMHDTVQKNLDKRLWLKITYLLSIISTYGVMFLASLLQLDVAHMFTCFIQCEIVYISSRRCTAMGLNLFFLDMIVLPSYINVLNIYALSNIHDVSWGTKGDGKAEALPTVAAVKQEDGTVLADINVAANKADLSTHYNDSKKELHASAALRHSAAFDAAASKARLTVEDEYQGFRTKLLLFYIFSNAALFAFAAFYVHDVDVYLTVLLFSIAFLQVFKLAGALLFVVGKLFTDVFGCCSGGAARRRKFQQQQQQQLGGPGLYDKLAAGNKTGNAMIQPDVSGYRHLETGSLNVEGSGGGYATGPFDPQEQQRLLVPGVA
ncbi:chitin synthase 1 [Zopfochytrium polystomum]|nr:chitin synthase 1 [Zopfochytrium polystomum]